jgi:hypothetical protein
MASPVIPGNAVAVRITVIMGHLPPSPKGTGGGPHVPNFSSNDFASFRSRAYERIVRASDAQPSALLDFYDCGLGEIRAREATCPPTPLQTITSLTTGGRIWNTRNDYASNAKPLAYHRPKILVQIRIGRNASEITNYNNNRAMRP